jgi:hypothetical protein
MFKIFRKTLDGGPLSNWGPWASDIKALALIWHCSTGLTVFSNNTKEVL